jgi:hypothetical protein
MSTTRCESDEILRFAQNDKGGGPSSDDTRFPSEKCRVESRGIAPSSARGTRKSASSPVSSHSIDLPNYRPIFSRISARILFRLAALRSVTGASWTSSMYVLTVDISRVAELNRRVLPATFTTLTTSPKEVAILSPMT